MNLDTGTVETLLPYIARMYAFELSPNDQFLAYVIPGNCDRIHVLDTSSSQDTVIPLGSAYEIAGDFIWRPDGRKLLFASGLPGWENGLAGTSVFSLTVANMHLQPLLLNDSRNLIPGRVWIIRGPWITETLLAMEPADCRTDRNWTDWELDTQTGTVFTWLTPTPGN